MLKRVHCVVDAWRLRGVEGGDGERWVTFEIARELICVVWVCVGAEDWRSVVLLARRRVRIGVRADIVEDGVF